MKPAAVFKRTYQDYLARIQSLDYQTLEEVLGIEAGEGEAWIILFGHRYHIASDAIRDDLGRRPPLAVCVILCQYLLMTENRKQANSAPVTDLVTFKDFRDAAPLNHFFSHSVEGAIARCFAGHIHYLDRACKRVGGEPFDADLAYEVKYRFTGLPRISVYLLFNDAEEGFPAQCTMLFERSAEIYLDMESLAMVGGLLAELLEDNSRE